ncbi:hypothetical protein [Limosilactobacillus portuensis]|uniref:hypothetical protein n=1 Tax=Limosilactobacillus portuensis TaxID=2742601 RepID=UPI003264D09A
MKNIGIGIFISLLGLSIPLLVSFMRSHYLYSNLKDTEMIFLSLERRFQIETTILVTVIMANFIVLFAGLIIFKITGWFILLATILDLIMFITGEAIAITRQNKHPKEVQVTTNDGSVYILLHRIDDKHISTRPSKSKDDDEDIVLLSIDDIANNKSLLKVNNK